jgi:hypothetical protein
VLGSESEMVRFHFAPAFEVVVAPEFPGDGDWRCPFFAYEREGVVQVASGTTWGAPTVVEVSLADDSRWIGTFAAGGLGGTSGVFATPDPFGLCVVNDGLAYLVDVRYPENGAAPLHWQVEQVVEVREPSRLLLVRFIDMVALGSEGVAWRSPRLAVDDLRVVSTVDGMIECTLDNLGGSETITLDAVTGEQVAGTRMDSFWPPDAR